jgi:hypothetical protein
MSRTRPAAFPSPREPLVPNEIVAMNCGCDLDATAGRRAWSADRAAVRLTGAARRVAAVAVALADRAVGLANDSTLCLRARSPPRF